MTQHMFTEFLAEENDHYCVPFEYYVGIPKPFTVSLVSKILSLKQK